MKTGKSVLAVVPGTRLKLSVLVGGKWRDLVDLARPEYDLIETDEGDLVESDERSRIGHLFEFEIDFFGWRENEGTALMGVREMLGEVLRLHRESNGEKGVMVRLPFELEAEIAFYLQQEVKQ